LASRRVGIDRPWISFTFQRGNKNTSRVRFINTTANAFTVRYISHGPVWTSGPDLTDFPTPTAAPSRGAAFGRGMGGRWRSVKSGPKVQKGPYEMHPSVRYLCRLVVIGMSHSQRAQVGLEALFGAVALQAAASGDE
jgi:hypothetical protein